MPATRLHPSLIALGLLAAFTIACNARPQPGVQPREYGGLDPASPLAPGVLAVNCGSSDCVLRVVDPLTGDDLAGFAPLSLGLYISDLARTPDGRTLALFRNTGTERAPRARLHLIDIEAWQSTATPVTLDGWPANFAFSPDGRRLVLASSQGASGYPPDFPIWLVDLEQLTIVAESELGFVAARLAYTADGQAIMAYGADNGPDFNGLNPTVYAALLGAGDLRPAWQTTLADVRDGSYQAEGAPPQDMAWLTPGLAFAPDKPALYVAHADANRLTTVDFGRRAIRTVEVRPARGWLDRLMALTAGAAQAKVLNGTQKQARLAPDGGRLFVVGRVHALAPGSEDPLQTTATPLGLQVVDVADGRLIAKFETEADQASVSADGRRLYLRAWRHDPAEPWPSGWTDVLDAESLALVARVDGRLLVPGQRLSGQPILLSASVQPDGRVEMAALEPKSLKTLYAEADWSASPPFWLTSSSP